MEMYKKKTAAAEKNRRGGTTQGRNWMEKCMRIKETLNKKGTFVNWLWIELWIEIVSCLITKTKTDSEVFLCPQTDAECRWLALCSYLSHAVNTFIACHWATHTSSSGHSLQCRTVGTSLCGTAQISTMPDIVDPVISFVRNVKNMFEVS